MRRLLSIVRATIVLAIIAIPGNPDPSGAPDAAQLGRAFAQPGADPMVSFTMYDASLQYRTLPFAPVTAELRGADGEVKAVGFGVSNEDGDATVAFSAGAGLFDFGESGTPIQPGDTLTLVQPGADPLDVVIPRFGAEIDLDGARLAGVGPAGAAVAVNLVSTGAPASYSTTATIDPTGAFEVDLTDALGMVPGGVSGSISMTTPEGYQVAAEIASLGAEVTVGTSGVSGTSTPGTMIEVTVEREGEDPRTFGPTLVSDGPEWAMNLGGGAGPGPGPGPGAGGALVLRAGDTVRISRSGGPVEVARTLTATLQAMTVEVNPATDTVSGTAPADAALALSADSIDGGMAEVAGMAGPDGTYSVPVGGTFDLAAGWRVRVAHTAAPGLSVASIAVLPKARIPVNLPIGQGFAAPGQTVTVTLRAASGDLKAVVPTSANPEGEYSFWLGGAFTGSPADMQVPEPGDTVELAFVEGDPTPMRVPDLSAIADTDADTVSGRADPGVEVTVDVVTADGTMASVMTTADASGTYSASLAGTLDLERPSGGTVSVTPLHGNAFYTTWAAAQLSVSIGGTLQGNFILGNGAQGRLVKAELLSPEGTVVASGESRVFGAGGFVVIGPGFSATGAVFFLSVADITGTPVDMQPGDMLRVTVADDVIELEIPPIDAVVFVDANTISGRTSPNSEITMWVSQAPPSVGLTVDILSDADGRFVHNFTGELDLKYGDQIQLGVAQREHMLLDFIIAPGLLVDLDQSLLFGSSGPNNEIFLTVMRDGETLYSDVTATDASGLFFTIFFDSSFQRIVLQPGDIIRAEAIDPELDVLELTVPVVEIEQDIDTDVIGGRASEGGTLTLIATEAYPRQPSFGIAQAWPTISGRGTWTADFVPSVNVKPGTRVMAIYQPENGHYALRTDTEPILNAEHSGPNACGFGDKRADVSVDLSDTAGMARAGAATTARFDGYFNTVLRDTSGGPVKSEAANRVAADLGTKEAEIELGPLDLTPNWEARFLMGTGPANSQYSVLPAVPCAEQQQPGLLNLNLGFAMPGATGEDGSITQFIPFPSTPGSGVEIAFYAENDHRWFRQFYQALAEIYLLTDRVSGQTNTLQDVILILRAPDGTEKARAEVKADESGAFDTRFVDAEGKPVVSAIGDTVVLEAAGESPEIPVESLLFDWSEGSSEIVGNGPAGRDVVLSLRFASGGMVSIDLTADERGRWLFTSRDVPPRAAWSMSDVVGVRATMQTPNGHSIISQTPGFEPGGPGPGPGDDSRTIYLPFASSNRAGVAVVEDGGGAAERSRTSAGPATASGPVRSMGSAGSMGSTRSTGPVWTTGSGWPTGPAWMMGPGRLGEITARARSAHHPDPAARSALSPDSARWFRE